MNRNRRLFLHVHYQTTSGFIVLHIAQEKMFEVSKVIQKKIKRNKIILQVIFSLCNAGPTFVL